MALPATRVIVIGAGVAGLICTLHLASKVDHETVRITLVNERDDFILRPTLHEFATNQRVRRHALPQVLRDTGVAFVRGRVTGLDTRQRRVVVRDERERDQTLDYDYLVYALGSTIARDDVPGVAEHAYRLVPEGPRSADALREALPAIAARGGQVVVCGGGATGIEMAAQVASVYPRIRVSLVTRGQLASTLGRRVADAARRRLARLGVALVERSAVREVRADRVALDDGRELASDACIWAAGFAVAPLAREMGLTVNARGQILVDPSMRSLSQPSIFAVGDAAMPVEQPGVPHMRMSAYTAGITGTHGADCLAALLAGQTPRPLAFAYLAQAIALGQGHAIFFPIYPDDRPRAPFIAGRLGALLRVAGMRSAVASMLAQGRRAWALEAAARRHGELPAPRRDTEADPERAARVPVHPLQRR